MTVTAPTIEAVARRSEAKPRYTIALVQNQSEMAHYGYADARPLLKEEYEIVLFTGDNIPQLAATLTRRDVDALVLGSNALNDRDILATLCTKEFAATLDEFMAAGRGFLCLQQLGLAMRKTWKLTVLPEQLGELLPTVPPAHDRALTDGRLEVAAGQEGNLALRYPEDIDLEAVRERACTFMGLPGLYWHYLDNVDLTYWDQLIVDRSDATVRPLLVVAKESLRRRAVVSALPLDWQKHENLFRNLLVYAIEGRRNIATLSDGRSDEAFDYLRATLHARRIPFGEYVLPRDQARVAETVRLGIHSTLLVAPEFDLGELSAELQGELRSAVGGGRLRVVDIGDRKYGTRTMNVVSRELQPRRLLQATELEIQRELKVGYIDDSFWGHVETLQTLDQFRDTVVEYDRLQAEAFKIARNHDRDGSYDEIFGPTCAYYWLRARYRGVDSDEARQTEAWLRRALPRYGAHERALAYTMFAHFETLTDRDRNALAATIDALDLADPTLRETEMVQYLRAAVKARLEPPLIASLSAALIGRRDERQIWVDLTTTATAADALLDAHGVLAPAGAEYRADCAEIERAALRAVVFILRWLARSEASERAHPYPWDGKANTTVKCLLAWLKFDAMQDLPLFEILETLRRSEDAATRYAADRTTLTVVQATNEENTRLRQEAMDMAARHETALGQLHLWRRGAIAAAVVTYVLLTVLAGALVGDDGGLGAAIETGFIDGWQYHSFLLLPLGGLAWRWWQKRADGQPEATADA